MLAQPRLNQDLDPNYLSQAAIKSPTDEESIDKILAQSIRNKITFDRKKQLPDKPPSQMTQRSGITIGGKAYNTQDIPRGLLGPSNKDLLPQKQ